MNISAYIAYHKPSFLIQSDCLIPIQVGAALPQYARLPMQGDDTGDHISTKNIWYSELTAHYWAWKNDTASDYLGVMHYRRVFNFYSNTKHQVLVPILPVTEEVSERALTQAMLMKYGLFDEAIRSCITGYDMILPEPFDFPKKFGDASLFAQYAGCNDCSFLLMAGKIIQSLYPEYANEFFRTMNLPTCFCFNMFLFKKDLFCEYLTWLFDILFLLEKTEPLNAHNPAHFRIFGHLSERLFNVFINHKIKKHPHLNVRILETVFFQNTLQATN